MSTRDRIGGVLLAIVIGLVGALVLADSLHVVAR
jgi:hypothetical protein